MYLVMVPGRINVLRIGTGISHDVVLPYSSEPVSLKAGERHVEQKRRRTKLNKLINS
jgi:hypothetical protein